MAKALFHKNQRVFVKPVGTYALVERVIPHWVKDVPEPLRVTYDVGLGRDFTGGELVSESKLHERKGQSEDALDGEQWRISACAIAGRMGKLPAIIPIPAPFRW